MGESLGHINVRIPDELEEKVRLIASRKFGLRKGFLTKAIVEALEEWIKRNEDILGDAHA